MFQVKVILEFGYLTRMKLMKLMNLISIDKKKKKKIGCDIAIY